MLPQEVIDKIKLLSNNQEDYAKMILLKSIKLLEENGHDMVNLIIDRHYYDGIGMAKSFCRKCPLEINILMDEDQCEYTDHYHYRCGYFGVKK